MRKSFEGLKEWEILDIALSSLYDERYLIPSEQTDKKSIFKPILFDGGKFPKPKLKGVYLIADGYVGQSEKIGERMWAHYKFFKKYNLGELDNPDNAQKTMRRYLVDSYKKTGAYCKIPFSFLSNDPNDEFKWTYILKNIGVRVLNDLRAAKGYSSHKFTTQAELAAAESLRDKGWTIIPPAERASLYDEDMIMKCKQIFEPYKTVK